MFYPFLFDLDLHLLLRFHLALSPRLCSPGPQATNRQHQKEPKMAADGQSFAISLGLNLLFLALIYFLFAVLRDAAPTKKFYAPRRYMRAATPGGGDLLSSPSPSPLRPGPGGALRAGSTNAATGAASFSSTSTGKRPKRLPTGWFAWIGVVHRATQEDVIGVAGMDAAVYLAFLKLCAFSVYLFLLSSSSSRKRRRKLTIEKKKKQDSQGALHLRRFLVPRHGPPYQPRGQRSENPESIGDPGAERVHLLDPCGDTCHRSAGEVDAVRGRGRGVPGLLLQARE